ncbi:MAG: hypothetical protein ACRCSP_08325 [Rhodoglobus sp.]
MRNLIVATIATIAALAPSCSPAMADMVINSAPPLIGSASQSDVDEIAHIVDKASPSELKSANQRAIALSNGAFSKLGGVSVKVPKNAQLLVSATKNTSKAW